MSAGHSSMNIKDKIQQDQVQQKNIINQVKVGPRKGVGIVPPWDTKNRQQIGRDAVGPSSHLQNSNFQSSQQQPKHYRLLQKPIVQGNKVNLKTQEVLSRQKQIGMNIDMTDQRSMPLRNHQQVHLLNEENNNLQTQPNNDVVKQNHRSYLNSNFSPQTLVNGQPQATMITAQTPSSTQQSQPTENTDQTHQTQITQITHITHQTQNSGFLIGSIIPQPLTAFGILGSNFGAGHTSMLQNSQDQQQLLTSSFRANSLKVGQQSDQEYEQREVADDEEEQSQRFNGQQSVSRDEGIESNVISSTQFYGKGEQRREGNEGSNLTEKYWTAQAQTSKGQINQGVKNTRPPAGRRVNDSQGTEQVSSQQSRQNDKKSAQKPSSIVQMIRERGNYVKSSNQLQNQSLTESVISSQLHQLNKNPEVRRPPTDYRNNQKNEFKQRDFEDQYNYYDEDSLEEAVNLSGISPDIAPPSQYQKNQGSQIIDHNGAESYFVQFGTMDQQKLMNKRSSSEIQRNQIQQIKKNPYVGSRQKQNKEISEKINPMSQQKQNYQNQKTHQVSNSQPTQNRSQQLSNTMIEGVNGPSGQGNGGAGYIDLSHIVGTGGSLQTHCHEEDEFDEGTTFNDQASQLNLQNSQATVVHRHNILQKNRQGSNSVFRKKNSNSPTHNILGVLETRYVKEDSEEEDIQDDEIEPLDGNDELYPHRTNFNKDRINFQYERQVQKEVQNSFFVSSSKDTPPVVEGGSQQTSKQDTLYKNQKELQRRPINDFQNLDANRAFTEGIEFSGNTGFNGLKIVLKKPNEKLKGNILTVSSDKLNLTNNMSNHQIKTEPACQTSYQNYVVGMVPSSAGSQTRAWLQSQNRQNDLLEPNKKQKIGYVRSSQNYQQGIRSGLETSAEGIMQNNYVHSFPAQAEEDDESNINSDDQDEYLEDPRHIANSSAANGPIGPVISVGFSSKKQLQRLVDKSSRPIATAQSASFITGQSSQTMLMRHRQNQPNYFNKELSTNLSQENMRTDQQTKRNLSLKAAGGYNRDFTDQGIHGVSGVSAISGQSDLSHINQAQSQYGPRPQTAQGKNTSMFSVLGGPTFQTINISNVSGGNSGLQVGAASSSTSGGLGTHYAARDSRLGQDQNSFQKNMPARQPNRPTLAQEKSQKLIFGAGHQKPCHSQDLVAIVKKNRGSSQQADNSMGNDQVVDPRLNIHALENDQQAIINPLLSQDQSAQHKAQLSSFMSAKTNLNNTVSQGVWQNRGVKIKMKRGVMPISSTPAAIATENGLILREKSSGNLSLQTNQTRLATQSQGRIQSNSGRPAISITPNSGQNDNNIPMQRQAQYYKMNPQQQISGIQNQSKKTNDKQRIEQQNQGYLSAQQYQVSQQFQERVKSTWQTNQSLISNQIQNQKLNKNDYQQLNQISTPQPTNGYFWPQTQVSHQTNPTQHAEFTEFGVMPEIDDGDLLNVEEDEQELYYYEDSEIARDNYPFNQEYKNNLLKVQQIKNKPSRVNIKREKRQIKQYDQYGEEDDQVNQENFNQSEDSGEDLVCSEGNQDNYIIPNKQKVQSPRYIRNKKRRQPSQDQRIRQNFNGESYGSQYSQPLEHETFSMQQDTFSKNNKQKASDGPEDPCDDEKVRGNQVVVNQNQVNFYKNKKFQIYEPQSVQLKSGQRTGAEYLEAIDRSPIYSRHLNQQHQVTDYGNEDDIQNQEIDDEDWQLWVDDQNLLQIDEQIIHKQSQTAKKQANLQQKFSPKNQQTLMKQIDIQSRSNQERVLFSQQISRQNQIDNMLDCQIMNTMQSQNSRARNYEIKLNLMQENIVTQIEQIRQQKKGIKSIKSKLQEEQKLLMSKQKILDEKVKNAEKTKNQVKRQGILNKNEAQKLKSLNNKFTELIQNAKMGLRSQHEFKGINQLQDELSGRLSSIQTLLELLLHDKKSLRSVIDSSDFDSNSEDSSNDSNLINYRSSDKKGKSHKPLKRIRDRSHSSSQNQHTKNKKVKNLKDSQSSGSESVRDESDKSERSIASIEIKSPKYKDKKIQKKQKKDKKVDQETVNLQNVVQSYEVKLQEMSNMMNNLIQLHQFQPKIIQQSDHNNQISSQNKDNNTINSNKQFHSLNHFEMISQQLRETQRNIIGQVELDTQQKNEKKNLSGQLTQNQDFKQNEEQIKNHQKNESIVSEFVFDPDPNFLLKINQNIRTNNLINPTVVQEIIPSGKNQEIKESDVQNDFNEVVQQHTWTHQVQPTNLFTDNCIQGTQGDFSVHQPPRQTTQNAFEALNQNYENSDVSQQLRQAINKTGLNTNEISRECTIGGREMTVSGFGDTATAFQGRALLSAESSQSKIPSSQMSVFQGLQQKLQTIQNQQTDRPLCVAQYGGYDIMGSTAQDYSTYNGRGGINDVTNNPNDLTGSIASDTYGLTGASVSAFGGNQMNTNNRIQYDEDLALNGDDELSMNPTMSPGPSIGTNKTHLIQSQLSANNRKEPLAQVQQFIQNINGKSNLDNFEVDYNPQKIQSKGTKIISEQIRSQTSRMNFQDSSFKKKIEEDEILRLIHESQEAQEWSESQSFYDSSQTDTFHHRPSGLKQNNDSQVAEIQNEIISKSPNGRKIMLRAEEDDLKEERRQILNESIVFDEYGQIFDMPKKAVYGIKRAKNIF